MICDRPYTGIGNIAQPVNPGRCCNACNMAYVVPARLARMQERDAKRLGNGNGNGNGNGGKPQ